MTKWLVTLTVLCASSAFSAETVVIPGTGDSQDLLRELARAYQAERPDTTVVIPDSTGSSGGIESAGTGKTKLGRTALRPSEEDIRKYGSLTFHEFARAPVVFVVSEGVDVSSLSGEQLCDLFSGKVTSWKDVGGPDLPVAVQTRPEGSNLKAIRANIGCFASLHFAPDGQANERNADLVKSMKAKSGAIGFMPYPEAKLNGIRVVKLDGRDPMSSDYPLVISLGFVYRPPLDGEPKRFVEYVSGPASQRAMRAVGYVPVSAGAAETGTGTGAVKAAAGRVTPPKVSGFIQGAFTTGLGKAPQGSFFLRRARVRVAGEVLTPYLVYALLTELVPTRAGIFPTVKDAFIGINAWSHQLKIGQFKTPFGWENPTAASALPLIERSLLSAPLASGNGMRDIGVGLFGSIRVTDAWKIEDGVAVVNGAGENAMDNTPKKDVFGRVGFAYRDVLRVGVSASSVQTGPPTAAAGIDSRRIGGDVQLDVTHAFFVAEVITAATRLAAGGERSSRGYYMMAIGRLPHGFEVGGRYEWFDADAAVFGVERRVVGGATYHHSSHAKLMVNYRRDVDTAGNQVLVQTQVVF